MYFYDILEIEADIIKFSLTQCEVDDEGSRDERDLSNKPLKKTKMNLDFDDSDEEVDD